MLQDSADSESRHMNESLVSDSLMERAERDHLSHDSSRSLHFRIDAYRYAYTDMIELGPLMPHRQYIESQGTLKDSRTSISLRPLVERFCAQKSFPLCTILRPSARFSSRDLQRNLSCRFSFSFLRFILKLIIFILSLLQASSF